jgi:hypothetical protein
MESNKKQKLFRDNLKKSIINGEASMCGRERTNEEKFLFKQKILKLYADGKAFNFY